MTEQDRIVVLEDNHRLRAENDILRANAADAAKELAAMADRELASDARKGLADVTEALDELLAIAEEQKAEIKRLRAVLDCIPHLHL